jgi:hypothetical protein
MAMNKSGHRPAGGPHSRNVKHTTAPKVEPRARGVNPSAVNQLGGMVGDHVTHTGESTGYRGEPLVRGPGYNAPVGPTNMMPSGPGGGRKVYASGSQGTQGRPARGNPEPARDILSSFGPESSRGR